jgi:ubiquinone/menaquinone biosynthesis C-methylase UbiE
MASEWYNWRVMAAHSPDIFTQGASEAYAKMYARQTGGYITSIRSILEGGLARHVQEIERAGGQATILEVGGGSGRSAWAIEKGLHEQYTLTAFKIISTEPNIHQVLGGLSSADAGDKELHIPDVLSSAQDLPIPSGFVDAVIGSQVIHWLTPRQVKESFRNAYRVLKPDGVLIHATSGIMDLGEDLNGHHFTRHPFVSNYYLPNLEQELALRGFWNREHMGEFAPGNPNAHRYYYRLSLNEIRDVLLTLFRRVSIEHYMFSCNTEEMQMRLTNLSAINMHFFGGPFADSIPGSVREQMANTAFEKAKQAQPELWQSFDSQPQGINIGTQPETFGEPVPVIIAYK